MLCFCFWGLRMPPGSARGVIFGRAIYYAGLFSRDWGLPPPPGPTHAANSFQLEDRNRGTLKLDNYHSGRSTGVGIGFSAE